MAFPTSPTNGQTYTINGVTYVYDSGSGVWDRQGTSASSNPVASVAGRTGAVTLTAADIGAGQFPGAVTMASTLGVSGATTLAALSATSGTFSTTLGVTGAATLSSTLGVTGAATLSSTLAVGSTLNVTGSSTLAALSASTGTFSSTLGVTGAATLSSSLSVGTTLGVTGASTLSGATSIGGALTYGGVALSNAVTGTGSMVLSASPTFTGTAGFANGTFSGTLGVTGTSTIGALSATTGTFSSTLGVTGATTLGSLSATAGTFSSTLGVTGAATLSSTLGVTGTLTAAAANFSGSATYSGNNKITLGPNSSWTQYLQIGGNGIDGSYAQIAATNGNLHLESLGGGYPIYLNYYRGGGVICVGTMAVTGAITATTTVTAYYSDERLKTKINNIENALDKIDQLTGFVYVENELAKSFGFNNPEPQVALGAHDVKKVQPDAVKPAPFDTSRDGKSISGENYLTVQYERLVPLLVEGIKELRREIQKLKGQ